MVSSDRETISSGLVEGRDVTICVPALNEASSIGSTLQALRKTFCRAQIIVVDDNSDDSTAEIAKSVEGITVISHSRNIGYGGSLKTAMRHATGRILAWFDGDGQHNPEDLKKILLPIIRGEKDAVIGARLQGSDIKLDRVPGKMLLKFVAETIAGTRIPDLNSGLRAFRAEVIRRYIHLLPDGFSASSTSTLIMIKRGYRLGFEPIITNKRSGVSSVKIMKDGLTTLHLILRMLILFDAFRFFSLISFLQVGPGFLYSLITTMKHGQGFPILGAIVIISGILSFLIGLVCDQLVALRRERFEG